MLGACWWGPRAEGVRLAGRRLVGGGFAGIEHLHNVRALPREVDEVWLFITGRNPNLTLVG